jgi:hypothetical protein
MLNTGCEPQAWSVVLYLIDVKFLNVKLQHPVAHRWQKSGMQSKMKFFI